MKIDVYGTRVKIRLSAAEESRLKADANKLGVSIQEMLQASLDEHARKMFPDVFKGHR